MSKRKSTETEKLEQIHQQFFKVREDECSVRGDEESLEQPYADEVVDSLTTDSAYTGSRFIK